LLTFSFRETNFPCGTPWLKSEGIITFALGLLQVYLYFGRGSSHKGD